MFSAVIFDMDGVLIDSEPIFRLAAQRAGAELGRVLTDQFYADLIGLPGPQIEAALRQTFGAEFEMDAFRVHFERNFREHVETFGIAQKPGVAMLLEELALRATPIAVATSTRSGAAELSLRSAGLIEHFAVIVTGDQVTAGKPAPDIFLRAAARLNIPPPHCIAIEDSEVGVRAAAGAGMHTIMVPDLKPPSAEIRALAHVVLPSMAAAHTHIMRLFDG